MPRKNFSGNMLHCHGNALYIFDDESGKIIKIFDDAQGRLKIIKIYYRLRKDFAFSFKYMASSSASDEKDEGCASVFQMRTTRQFDFKFVTDLLDMHCRPG